MARALGMLPLLSRALARGELSYAKVRELTRVATPETEARLLAVGRAGTAAHVERIVRGWRRVDRKAEAREDDHQHAGRALHVYPDEDGTVRIRGRLAPEVGALDQAPEADPPTPSPCSPRARSTTASIPARRENATRWWFTWMPPSWPTPTRPVSPSSRTGCAFRPERRSAWRATRAGS